MSMLLAATVSSTDSASVLLTEDSLADGNRLQDMHFPKGTLVMMVKRGNSFMVPNGQLELRPGDILLTIAQQSMTGNQTMR